MAHFLLTHAHTMTIHNQLVHPSGTQCGAHSTHYYFTGIDVADDLGFPLGSVCSLFQQDYRWSLRI